MISRPKEKKLYDPNAPTVRINTRNDHVEEDKKKEKAKNPLQEIYSFILKSEKSLEKNSMPFELRISLAEQYDLIIKNDFRLSVKYDLDNRKWKHCVYNLIAKERSKFKVLGKEEIKEWNTFLEKMMENYKEIIVLLKESHPGKLYWTPMLNHLADLHRYRAQYFSDDKEGDWKTCRNYYLELTDYLPTNGHAWSQLGLVASSRKLFLEAIMMYLRALNVSKPFASAREMVLASYHDALGLNSIIKIEKLFMELSQIIFSKIGYSFV
jgi:tetratricopeptide (TPR) repeat protein